jgi:phosphoribosylamine--glycine ligase
MKTLILGSGGREHAFAHAIAKSSLCEALFVAPGNAGTAQIAQNLSLSPTDFGAVKQAVLQQQIELVVVGPEAPLVEGICDFFRRDPELAHVLLVGPSSRGATLEGSKEFAKEFMVRHHIPTAAYQSFTRDSLEEGKIFLEQMQPPYVLKADGLAAGKGVLILDSLEAARSELENMLTHNKFGNASSKVVIEEFMDGIELSVFVLTDGKDYKILPTAKDYKRIGEGDTGLNTGGMGAVSPAVFADETFMQKVKDRIVIPTVKGIQEEEIDYKGFIFIGLIKVDDDPYVIEYNVRMGDPETEVVLPRIKTDLLKLLKAAASGRLAEENLEIDPRAATTVMLVSGGYPEDYQKGKVIDGLDNTTGVIVYHAGTTSEGDKIKTSGGRVIAVTAMDADYNEALKRCYQNIERIYFDGMNYRTDIGFDLP